MPFTVCHISNQIRGNKLLSGVIIRQHFLQGFDNDMDNFNVLLFIMPADVIGFKQPALLLHHINRLCMVLHIQPVTDILSIPVYRKLLALQSIVDN